ncbi:NAD(P)-dependent oxidoreductase [Janthinobacterium sp. SUN073]|uniref:NAD-dependent epimerase/dehydratase family protein n=1 Tax=Janthinobacterium sp. SUN073 TaxID=3004102 RepID=UPI0025B07FB1|nr:NAD(P)-dependent oxidoreductase [Janthinobacterium sp. SUN073]MDN2696117.1 NAD(P)-dependent oxidoreductase [Janthinobacterium sp. SUN073]
MILLTGGTGFLGSRILAELLNNGDKVVVIKRSFSNTKKIEDFLTHENVYFFDIDIYDPQELFKKYSIKTIIHAATEYGRGTTPIVKLLEANLILPMRLVEIGLNHGVECFINTDSFFTKRTTTYSNLANYSLSKKSLINWLKQLPKNIKIINVVLEHIYGPDDDTSKFIENTIQKIAVQKVPEINFTHGHQKRDFVYIDDVVAAYIKLIQYGSKNNFCFETFEVGTGRSYEVREMIETIQHLSGSMTKLNFGAIGYRSDEIMESKAEIKKLMALGWNPTITLQNGIEKILKKYKVIDIK